MFDDLFVMSLRALRSPFFVAAFFRPFTLPSTLASTKQNKTNPFYFFKENNNYKTKYYVEKKKMGITFFGVNIEIFIWDDELSLCETSCHNNLWYWTEI